MKSIAEFAGVPSDRAHVEPEARALLSRVGRRVKHFDVERFGRENLADHAGSIVLTR
ncbi:MAG: hypothetical protein ABIR28_03220 [Vicinamibacteria bacterium]